MKISLNWLKEFVDLDGITKEDIDKKVNQMCAEIENIEEKGADIKNVVYGKILEVKNHPESQKLHILKVDVGEEVLQIVCGAPNVKENMVTMVAKVGGMVCGKKIGPAKLAGVESFGMCCSESELGIGSDDSGIVEVKYDVKLGTDIKKVLPIDDLVIEIDNKTLTNRPDLWGHYGFAREFSAIFKRPLNPLETLDLSKLEGLERIKIKVSTPACLRYSAISCNNITKTQSPEIMKIRLNYCGMRDINFLADLTNYIMLELGQPMHAFDNEKVKEIEVVSSKKGDKLLTLEGEEHEVPENSVLICDGNKNSVAIAGIKGGLMSGITEKTSSVLFESATFTSEAIRKTSRAIGLITDASLRYEKSLDPELTKTALARLLYILTYYDDGAVITSSFSDCYNYHYDKIKINVSADFISRRIGIDVNANEVKEILERLGFSCNISGENLEVLVPSFRATKDISIKEDLVEEVARMLNYGAFTAKPLAFNVEPVVQDKEHTLEYQAKFLLASKYNANEVHSYIWDYTDFNAEHKIETKPVLHLMDTRNAGQSAIRDSLVPTLIKFASENKESEENSVRIFEIGRCVPSIKEDGLANEEKHLAVVFSSSDCSEEELLVDLKNYLVDLSENYVYATLNFEREEPSQNYMHKVNTFAVKFNGEKIGYIGVISPIVSKTIDKKLKMVATEINFKELAKCRNYPKKVKVPSLYQSTHLDLNFVMNTSDTYADAVKALSKIRSKLLVGYKLVEVFENPLTPNKKSMLFRFEINGKDHSLVGEEIDGFMNDVINLMEKAGYPLKK
ncbi:MAG: phenylalanine--tRNA ligase subunit beta [Clostridia bacterium]|nr:phenylalanine--tRNA ligase subunit beta [Clostridia bacterium]